MDIIKFNNPTASTKMEQAEIVNGLNSKMWIERYDKAGEFTLVANANTSMRNQLPIGSFISHVDTAEIMIVENHEISDDQGKEAEIVISGRGYETFLEHRVVGSNKTFPRIDAGSDFLLNPNPTSEQARALVLWQTDPLYLIDDNDALLYFNTISTVTGLPVDPARVVARGDLYSRFLEILAVDGLGVKIIRPGPWSPLGATSPNTAMVIHTGIDRTDEIIFSSSTGEIKSAEYLWSNKKAKNCALVSGKWVEVLVSTAATEYNRRMMFVDASSIDNGYSVAPTGAALTDVQAYMRQRGIEALVAQYDVALTKAEVSKETNNSLYRVDFDVGDFITVDGEYNETASMQISEYVEIEDENGNTGYPTLTMSN